MDNDKMIHTTWIVGNNLIKKPVYRKSDVKSHLLHTMMNR